MKKTIIKICSVIIVATLIISAAYLTGFDIGGISKVFGATTCEHFDTSKYKISGDFAYVDFTFNSYHPYSEDLLYKLDGVKIVDYHGSATEVVFPEYINGKPVLCIEQVFGFSKCTNKTNLNKVEKVVLPSTLKIIGNSLFENKTNLKSVVIPEGVEYINEKAFKGCSSLEGISFPDSVSRISKESFKGCQSIESIVLPKNLYNLSNYAFEDCTSLTSVTFNENLYRIFSDAFENCNIETLEFNEGLKEIHSEAFKDNPNLKKVVFPENLSRLGSYVFDGCTSLEELTFPDKMTSFPMTTLTGSGVKNFTLPKSVVLDQYDIGTSLDTLVVQGNTLNDGALSFNINTLIYKGFGEIDERVFVTRPDDAVPNYKVPDKVIFTDGIDPDIDVFLCDTMGYFYHYDTETGYRIYEKEYTGDERYRHSGSEFVSGDYKFDITAENNAIITAYTGTETETITVPENFELDGVTYSVIVIGRRAFENCQAKEIILPETIEKIESYAFYNCVNLLKSNIPDGITQIAPYTYGKCTNMTEINIPDSVVYIEDRAFFGRRPVTELVIPSTVKFIGSKAFYNHYFITSLTLSEGIEEIGAYAFSSNTSSKAIYNDPYDLIPITLVLPSTVTKIGEGVFEYSGVSGEVVIPEGITEISDRAFARCYLLTSVTLHEGITRIGASAFEECDGITAIKLPSKLTEIGDYSFIYTRLTSITLPSTLKYLGAYSFACTELSAVTIPSSVEHINEGAFSGCENMTTVNLANGIKYISAFAFSGNLDRLVIPPSVREITYNAFWEVESIGHLVFNATCYEYDLDFYEVINKTHLGGFTRFQSPFRETVIDKLTIGTAVKYIPCYCFEYATINEIVFSSNIIAIGNSAFKDINASSAENFVIPNTVKTIEEDAFYSSSFKVLTLPENLEYAGPNAFSSLICETLNYNTRNGEFDHYKRKTGLDGIYKSPFVDSKIKNIIIGENVEVLPEFIFCSLAKLETVHIPDKVTTLSKGAFAFSDIKAVTGMVGIKEFGDYLFYSCANLEAINIDNKLISEIGNYAFYGCTSLTEFNIGNSNIIDIGAFAFSNTGLTSFNGGALLESVGDSCFAGCVNLTNLDLGTKIMLIGNNAFEGCTSLKIVIVPDTVKDVGDRAFADCTALETVYMSVNVNFIPTECFYNDAVLSSFTWESASKLIGRLAFGNCTSLNTFNFIGIEKLYESSFFNSGVMVVSLGEALNEADALLEEIQASSFQNCAVLETVSIGGNIETVSNLAFAGCSNLEVAIISDNVTEIADNAFDDCPNLTFVCSETSYAYSYASANGIPVSTLVIAPIPNKTYTGYAIRPAVTVTFSGSTLTKDIDFSVSYSNNTNVGQATVNVNGKGAYEMLSSRASFTIVTRNISKVSISAIKDQDYTGKAVEPSLTITDNGRYLTEGKDYRVSYYNNTSQGTASAVITGIGNYSGTVHTSFKITELDNGEIFLNWLISIMTDFFAKIVNFFSLLR